VFSSILEQNSKVQLLCIGPSRRPVRHMHGPEIEKGRCAVLRPSLLHTRVYLATVFHLWRRRICFDSVERLTVWPCCRAVWERYFGSRSGVDHQPADRRCNPWFHTSGAHRNRLLCFARAVDSASDFLHLIVHHSSTLGADFLVCVPHRSIDTLGRDTTSRGPPAASCLFPFALSRSQPLPLARPWST